MPTARKRSSNTHRRSRRCRWPRHWRIHPETPRGRREPGRGGRCADHAPPTGRGSTDETHGGNCSAAAPPHPPRTRRGTPRSSPAIGGRRLPPGPGHGTGTPAGSLGSARPTLNWILIGGFGGGGWCPAIGHRSRGCRGRGC